MPGMPLTSAPPSFEVLRSSYAGTEPLDDKVKGAQRGPAATIDGSRDISLYIVGQMNAVLFGKGGSVNIFA